MQVAIDPYDSTTAYADLKDEEPLSDALRERALQRALQLGAKYIEIWRPPYGSGRDRMAGFVELVKVQAAHGSARVADGPVRA